MNDHTILRQVEAEYINNLKNLDVKNPRLLILFSGPPGSGKTTIAKAIEKEFAALRIASDDARRILYTKYPDMTLDEINRFILMFMAELLPKVEAKTTNGLWIADASIDRNYKLVKDFADEHGFKTLIIAITLSEQEHHRRIEERGAHPFASLQKILSFAPQRRDEQAQFLSTHSPDIVVETDTDINQIIEEIRKRLLS